MLLILWHLPEVSMSGSLGNLVVHNTLWWTNILLWKITIFNGKIHYKWPFSIAMLVHQGVYFTFKFRFCLFFVLSFRRFSECLGESFRVGLRASPRTAAKAGAAQWGYTMGGCFQRRMALSPVKCFGYWVVSRILQPRKTMKNWGLSSECGELKNYRPSWKTTKNVFASFGLIFFYPRWSTAWRRGLCDIPWKMPQMTGIAMSCGGWRLQW